MEHVRKVPETSCPGFSISNILGLGSKEFQNCQREVLHENQIENYKVESPKSSYSGKSEKVKRVKRLISDAEGKRYRATFDKAQIFQMERIFLLNHYPDVAARSGLSKRTALSESQVQIWFQNRRAKWRKQQRKRRTDIPPIFGLGYPTHLARLYSGYDPYAMFSYEYYNTDFWACAQQQIAALHYSGISAPALNPLVPSPLKSGESSKNVLSTATSPVSSPGSSTTRSEESSLDSSPDSKGDRDALEIRNDSSLLSLRLKAKEHVAALNVNS